MIGVDGKGLYRADPDSALGHEILYFLVEWECDGKYITILNFPEKASVLPEKFETSLIEKYNNGETFAIAWYDRLGWVGLEFTDFMTMKFDVFYQQNN